MDVSGWVFEIYGRFCVWQFETNCFHSTVPLFSFACEYLHYEQGNVTYYFLPSLGQLAMPNSFFYFPLSGSLI